MGYSRAKNNFDHDGSWIQHLNKDIKSKPLRPAEEIDLMPVMAKSAWLDDGIVIGIVGISLPLIGSPRASNPLTGRDFTEAQQITS